MKDKSHPNWCSKHQAVHKKRDMYKSCSFPNDKADCGNFKSGEKDCESCDQSKGYWLPCYKPNKKGD